MLIIARVIFVHGIGTDISEDYWKEWALPVRDALIKQGVELTEGDFDGVYYTDIFSNIDKSDTMQEEEKEKFILQLKSNMQKDIGKQMSICSRGRVDNLINQGVQLFGQMFYYFRNDQIYRRVNDRLYDKLLITGGPVYLIGFSLGSLISFCSLQQRLEVSKKIKNFIMVGSPIYWLLHGVELRANVKEKPTLNYFTNVAAKWDIAWPQKVPYIVKGLDEHVSVTLNKINPVEVHMSYFKVSQSINSIAELIKKY